MLQNGDFLNFRRHASKRRENGRYDLGYLITVLKVRAVRVGGQEVKDQGHMRPNIHLEAYDGGVICDCLGFRVNFLVFDQFSYGSL